MTTVSVIFPVYNERENLRALTEQVHPVLEEAASGDFEVIFVDDGSRDGSSEILDGLSAGDRRYRVVHLSRNFGHQAALQAGLDHAGGDAVVLMDADLQDPPELLARLIEKWREGYDVVYAVRRKRKESIWKRAAYAAFYRSLKAVADIETPLDAGDFCLMDRRVAEALVGLRERNRFLRGLRSWVGFRQVGVEYERQARHAGEPKYTLRKLIGLAVSGYVGFSALPLRIAAWLGVLSACGGFGLFVWVVIVRYTKPVVPQGWASTSALVLFVGGVQMVMLGVIGEYLGRVYDEVRGRPLYLVGSRVGFDRNATPQRAAVAGSEWLAGQQP
jgi:glycosyltransferase involved in cell wall biosynthesis